MNIIDKYLIELGVGMTKLSPIQSEPSIYKHGLPNSGRHIPRGHQPDPEAYLPLETDDSLNPKGEESLQRYDTRNQMGQINYFSGVYQWFFEQKEQKQFHRKAKKSLDIKGNPRYNHLQLVY